MEIQRALLAGEVVSWRDASAKAAALNLATPVQRRLFAYLLATSVREAKDLPDAFVAALATAFEADGDPAKDSNATSASPQQLGPWKLQAIETEGFGGLNTWGGPPLVLQLEAESLLLQGPNGTGKSSLVCAVLWAMTGERPRDHSEVKPEERADVYSSDNKAIGTWPPVACYPDNASKLSANPFVRVTLTFVSPTGATAKIERVLKDGAVSYLADHGLEVPDILIETGLLMPSRMPHIRFQKGQTQLTKAVQILTGLDDLIDIGALVEGLCHKGREYLKTNASELAKYKVIFDAALAEVARALAPAGLSVSPFEPKDTDDAAGPMAAFGKQLRERAAELTQVIADDLVQGLDLRTAQVQQDLAGAISGAREDLDGGLVAIQTWKTLVSIHTAMTPEIVGKLKNEITLAQSDLATAIELGQRSATDSRLRLKALSAQWHEQHRKGPISTCPLCDEDLIDRTALAEELETLRMSGEAATRLLADNLNAIRTKLDATIPSSVTTILAGIDELNPRRDLIKDLEHQFVVRERYSRYLSGFTDLVRAALMNAPVSEVTPISLGESGSQTGAEESLRRQIESIRQLLKVADWFKEESQGWLDWWETAAGATAENSEGQQQTGSTRETLSKHLDRLAAAISEAEPYRIGAEALGRAWENGKEASTHQKEQERREKITSQLEPLKALGSLAESQARQAIDELSDQISAILKRIQVSERLEFQGAYLERKKGLVVHAGFDGNLKIDATLVANTSWLRAVLWAFLFALRHEAVQQLGQDCFPVLVLDDPQATFDAEHRHRWAREIVSLQQEGAHVQILLTTYDETFLELLKIDGVTGREAIIASAGPELGHVGIFEGAALARKWFSVQSQNTPQAGRDYMIAVRIYAEGMLQLMLRGEVAGVSAPGSGSVIGTSRAKLDQLHKAGVSPWDKTEFSSLVGQLGNGLAPIKYVEMAHHASGANLGMAEAGEVEEHWRRKLQPALEKAFRLVREHQLLHGGLKALQAAEPTCTLPEGYQSKVAAFRLDVLGKAAALSNGRAADGRVELTLGAASDTIVLGRHSAYRLSSPTMEPVARVGDVLLVQQQGEPTPRSLVVARSGARLVARRFEIADNHSDVAVLTAQAVNPRQISAPLVVKRATLALHKVIGVLFDYGPPSMSGDGQEVCDCGGESILHQLIASSLGLVSVDGQSAEPIALDGQFLLIGPAIGADEAMARFDGRPVIARDEDDNRYFKRFRPTGATSVVLESLEIGGDFPPVVLTHRVGVSSDLAGIWPVLGVLFERPR